MSYRNAPEFTESEVSPCVVHIRQFGRPVGVVYQTGFAWVIEGDRQQFRSREDAAREVRRRTPSGKPKPIGRK